MARSLSATAHESILTAFIKLLEDAAVDDISTDAIAQAAGASKATLYKHWKDKEALLIDVVGRLLQSQPQPDSGDFRTDVLEMLRNVFVPQKRDPYGRAWPSLFSYSFTHPEFCRAVHKVLSEQLPQYTIMGVVQAASAAGVLRKNLDPGFALDLLAGPLMHHRFLHGSVPSKLPEQVVKAVWPTLM